MFLNLCVPVPVSWSLGEDSHCFSAEKIQEEMVLVP